MKEPRFITELRTPKHQRRLRWSIGSGYAVVGSFVLLAAAGNLFDLFSDLTMLYWLAGSKALVNTVAWFAYRSNRFVVTMATLNLFADVIAMTGAIYVTGGVVSPLLPIYAILFTVVALTSNATSTLVSSYLVFITYTTMLLAVHWGVLPQTRALSGPEFIGSDAYLAIAIVFAAFVIGVPTYFAVSIVRALRERQGQLKERTAQLVAASAQLAAANERLEEEIKTRQAAQAHAVNAENFASIGVLASGVAHEVNNALGIIQPNVELIASRLGEETIPISENTSRTVGACVQDVLVGVERIHLVATDLLFLAGHAGMGRDQTHVHDAFETAMRIVGPEAVGVAVDKHFGMVPEVVGSGVHLARAFVSLLLNAMSSFEKGQRDRRVTVRTYQVAQRVRVDITDNGRGIAPEDLPRVFDPYFTTGDADAGKTGMGLSIARSIVERMNGTLDLESEVGVGTTAHLELAAAKTPRAL